VPTPLRHTACSGYGALQPNIEEKPKVEIAVA